MTKKALIADIAQKLKSYGYRVFIAQNGEYGFYTDGQRCVSFGGPWNYCVDFSGNYQSSQPRSCGTGWQIEGAQHLGDIDAATAEKFIKDPAPRWATGGHSFTYTTPEQYLKTYGSTSGFTEA